MRCLNLKKKKEERKKERKNKHPPVFHGKTDFNVSVEVTAE